MEHLREYQKKWREANRDKIHKAHARYRATHLEEVRERQRDWAREKRQHGK